MALDLEVPFKITEKENYTKLFSLSIKSDDGVLALLTEGDIHSNVCISEISEFPSTLPSNLNF